MDYLFPAIYIFWFATEVAFSRMMRSSDADRKADKSSLRLLWVTIIITIYIAGNISFKLPLQICLYPYFRFIGLAMIMAGIAFRFYAIRSLGRMFTVDVSIRQGHQLKKDGIYSILRHPSYTGALFTFLGFAFSLNNIYSLILIAISVTTVFLIRIRIEEAALTEAFGNEYLDYKKQTNALIPFVY